MKPWKEILKEASQRQKELEAKVAELDDVPASLKGGRKNKNPQSGGKETPHTRNIARIQAFREKKYEEQKQKEIQRKKEQAVKAQQSEVERHKQAAGASLKGVQTAQIGSDDPEGTAYSKLMGNVASTATGIAGAAGHGVKAIAAQRKLSQVKKQEFKSRQPELRQRQNVGRPTISKSAPKSSAPTQRKPIPSTSAIAPYNKGGKVTTTPKKSIPATKKLPAASKSTLGQRARENPALKSELMKSRMEEYSNWREEFLWEVDTKKYQKLKVKDVDIMRGKNKIEVNPDTGNKNEMNPMTGVKEAYDDETFRQHSQERHIPLSGRSNSSKVTSEFLKKMKELKLSGSPTKKKKKKKKIKESISIEDAYGNTYAEVVDIIGPNQMEPIVEKGCWKGYRQTVEEAKTAAWQRKEGKNPTGGLNAKGRASAKAQGHNLKPPVTTPPSELNPDSKAAKRRKSFCARMGGMPGPMKDEKGRPTRKALSLRKWNC